MEDVVKFKKQLLSREYGTNIRNLVEFVNEITDRTKRTEQAVLLKKLIEKMNPSLKYAENSDLKVWQDMYVMGGMSLDIDVEFEKPSLESLRKKAETVPYNRYKPRFKHYGKNIELIMEKLKDEKDEEVRAQAIIGMGKLMKTFYRSWNKESVDDTLIAKQIDQLSNGDLKVPEGALDDPNVFESRKIKNSGNNSSNNNNNNNNSNNNNNNNKNRNRNNRNRKKK